MASGDLTASTPVYKEVFDSAGIKAAIDALNLAATTDKLAIVPIRNGSQVMIFKIERTA